MARATFNVYISRAVLRKMFALFTCAPSKIPVRLLTFCHPPQSINTLNGEAIWASWPFNCQWRRLPLWDPPEVIFFFFFCHENSCLNAVVFLFSWGGNGFVIINCFHIFFWDWDNVSFIILVPSVYPRGRCHRGNYAFKVQPPPRQL